MMILNNIFKKITLSNLYNVFKLLIISVVVGLLAGLSSWAFLTLLKFVTDYREGHQRIIYLLPFVGCIVVGMYHHYGAESKRGNGLLVEQIHESNKWIPRRMAPLVFFGTVITHLFGGSVGREGAALQISGSLTDSICRRFHITTDRTVLLVAAIAGGFGAIFGVPFAGVIFALEVHDARHLIFRALVPATIASFVGNYVVEKLAYHHYKPNHLSIHIDSLLVLKIALIGFTCGMASTIFVEAVHVLKNLMNKYIPYTPLHAFIAGISIIALSIFFGSEYLGLSLSLINSALSGEQMTIIVPLMKLIFTVICLAGSYPGGEVTPLLAIGATLGASLSVALGVPIAIGASIGFLAVFAGASRTPFACSVMGFELFGMTVVPLMVLACFISRFSSFHKGMYVRK